MIKNAFFMAFYKDNVRWPDQCAAGVELVRLGPLVRNGSHLPYANNTALKSM